MKKLEAIIRSIIAGPAFCGGLFLLVDALVVSPQNIMQQIYVAMILMMALLCFCLFVLCMIWEANQPP